MPLPEIVFDYQLFLFFARLRWYDAFYQDRRVVLFCRSEPLSHTYINYDRHFV